MMEARRKSLGDVPGTATLPNLASILERSPLLDRRQLRSWSSTAGSAGLDSKSVSVFHLQRQQQQKPVISRTSKPAHNLSGMNMKIQTPPQPSVRSLPRSRSAPFYRGSPGAGPYSYQAQVPRSSDHAEFRSSPQYRVNPVVVRFDERLLPERMNYGIAGYNTSRPRSLTPTTTSAESSRRGIVIRTRPRSVQILRLWTRRLRVRMIRIRVKSACSRLIKRFRRRRRQE